MPWTSGMRWKLPTGLLACLGLVPAILSGGLAGPAQAAVPASQVTKLFDASPYVPIPAGSFSTKSTDFKYGLEGHVFLSANPDGTGSIFNYDAIEVDVNGVNIYKHSFRTNCTAPAIPIPPVDLDPYLHSTSTSRLTARLMDNCGYVGSTSIYLVVDDSGTQPPYAPPAPPATNCGPAKFFGVRGSGETSKDFSGFGNTMGMMSASLYNAVPGTKSEAIGYPAIPVNPFGYHYSSNYVNSVNQGISALTAALRYFFSQCPHTYAVVGGYSQGAEVVDRAYAQLTDSERAHIAAVAVFGDPEFIPNRAVIDVGDYLPSLSGINIAVLKDRPIVVPTPWVNRNRSYCTIGDPICNFSVRNLSALCTVPALTPACPHAQYPNRGWTDVAAKWAATQLRSLPAL